MQVALWRVASGRPGRRRPAAAGGPAGARRPRPGARRAARRRPSPTTTRRRSTRHAARTAEVLVEAALDERRRRAGRAASWRRCGSADLSDARRAHLAQRLADTRFFRERDLDGALAAHDERPGERLTDPEVLAAVDARRATPAGRRRTAGRGAAHHRRRSASVTSPRTRVELAAAPCREPAQRRSLRRGASRSPAEAAADHADLPGWLARRGIAQHLAQRGPRPRLRRSLRRGPPSCSSRPPSGRGPRARWGRGSGSRWRWPRSPATPGAATRRSGASGRRRTQRPDGRPARGAGVGPRRRRPGPPAARRVRSGGRGAAAGRRGRRQPGGHVGRRPGSGPGRGSTRAGAISPSARRADPRRGRVGDPARRDVHLRGSACSTTSSASALPNEAVDRLEELAALHRRSAGARSTPPTPGPLVDRDVVAQAEVVDRYEAHRRARRWPPRRPPSWPTCTGPARMARLAATAAQRARPTLADRAGRAAHPGAGPRARGRAADRPRAGGGAARRRAAAAAASIGDHLGLSTAHRRHPPGPGLPQARHRRPGRAGRRPGRRRRAVSA